MVTACYWPVVNGVTRMVNLYKKGMEDAGHEVNIFTLGDRYLPSDESQVFRSPGIPIRDTGYYVGLRYTPEAQHILAEMDIVHCHHLMMSLEFANRYARSPIVFTNHTRYDLYAQYYLQAPKLLLNSIMGYLWRRMTSYSNVIIAPSESLRRVMVDVGVRRPIIVIPNGIEIAHWDRDPSNQIKCKHDIPLDAPLLVYVGRLSPEKGVSKLLAEFATASKRLPELHLMLIGDGPSKNRIKQEVYQLNLSKHVVLVGSLNQEKVSLYLSTAEAFVSASETEVHPLSVIEALAAGKPVVAIASPGITDIVDNHVTGLLVSNESGVLSNAIVRIVRDKKLRRHMSKAARRASGRYHIQFTVDQTLSLYRRLLRENVAAPAGT
jgi:glycosyltransferase involved in cell wall biosynthesis